MSTIRKQQHYVPKSLLDNFCQDETKRLYMLKRADGGIVHVGTTKIAKSGYLYDSILDGNAPMATERGLHYDRPLAIMAERNKFQDTDLESFLGVMENNAIAAIRALERWSDARLDDEE